MGAGYFSRMGAQTERSKWSFRLSGVSGFTAWRRLTPGGCIGPCSRCLLDLARLLQTSVKKSRWLWGKQPVSEVGSEPRDYFQIYRLETGDKHHKLISPVLGNSGAVRRKAWERVDGWVGWSCWLGLPACFLRLFLCVAMDTSNLKLD